MSDRIEWGGWALEGRILIFPRRVQLRKGEAKLMYKLLDAHGSAVSFNRLVENFTTHAALRQYATGLRSVIGKSSIETVARQAYRLRSIGAARASEDPMLDLVKSLEAALVSARRLQKDLQRKESL